MKMAHLNSWLADAIAEAKSSPEFEEQIVKKMKEFFEEEYKKGSNEEVKISGEEINELL